MIIINKSGYLKYKNLRFRCALGKAGVGKKMIEGDNITPKGTYKIIRIYCRKDRIKKIKSKIKIFKINKNMGWCDDSRSTKYNRLIKLPSRYKYEKFYRDDHLYDLILILNYNMKPVIKNKGSAIFIHLATKNYSSTKGCVGLSKNNLLKILRMIDKDTKIKIL
jgi:L,D-peptidoglycan transpeptidase YkuD (ErfK/YbiS/YcfS/YnhG family)